MASEEHKHLAEFIKEVHSSLRKSSSKIGAEDAWRNHCEKRETLVKYAQCMEKLATTYWEENCSLDSKGAKSRIKWAADLCYDYFIRESYNKFREKEIDICKKIDVSLETKEKFSVPLKLIDVGSCYNPFKIYPYLDVFAIDLCPANDSVLLCDFLCVSVGLETIVENFQVKQLEQNSFEVVTFCFLLEYIPNSDLRISACKNAYDILKPGGLLIINTPDSKHVGANYKIMKCWRYTLAIIGFTRIKYEKFKHMHCMGFRKSLNKATAVRWASIHKEPYMEYAMHIPQDFYKISEELPTTKTDISLNDFKVLPYCDID